MLIKGCTRVSNNLLRTFVLELLIVQFLNSVKKNNKGNKMLFREIFILIIAQG